MALPASFPLKVKDNKTVQIPAVRDPKSKRNAAKPQFLSSPNSG